MSGFAVRALRRVLPVALLAWTCVACGEEPEVQFDARERALLRHLSPLGPVPADPTNRVADDPDAAHLGQWLFFDPRLSADGRVSCATCHDPAHAFADPKPLAVGMGRGERHAPSLVNVAYHRWFGWGGRADTLWMQATGPLENPVEMGGNRDAIVDLLLDDGDLGAAYVAVFGELPDPADPAAGDTVLVNVAKALAAYQRRLVRDDARFDRFVAALEAGDPLGGHALDPAEQRGLKVFLNQGGCTQCHLGPNFSDGEFHNTAAPPHPDGPPDDPGRFRGIALVQASEFHAGGVHSDDREGTTARRVAHVVKSSESFGAFQTPSLRNLEGRAPYMHQGQFPDLASVLRFYDTREGASVTSHHQEQILEPLRLSDQAFDDLLAFLASLEGRPLDPALLEAPVAPGR